jgi:N-acetylglutamate synthase
MSATPVEIEELETLAFAAWPAARVEAVEGWRLRTMSGVTRRANSVFTCGAVSDVDSAVGQAEAFYAEHGQPAIFQLTPGSVPAGLDGWLSERGYAAEAAVSIQTARLDRILASDLDPRGATASVATRRDEAWSELAVSRGRFARTSEVFEGLLARLGERAAFALAELDGKPVATALLVPERGWLGIFAMATEPKGRRKGAASALLHAAASFGLTRDAAFAYLQVERENAAALELYARAGFAERYGYHYRVKRRI